MDLGKLFRGHFLGMGEVEAETDAVDVGSALCHMVAEHEAEGLVKQVRGGVEFGGRLGMVGETTLVLAFFGGLGVGDVLLTGFLVALHVDGEVLKKLSSLLLPGLAKFARTSLLFALTSLLLTQF